MDAPFLFSLDLATPEETDAFAARLAALLRPGDVILLEGDIGAGKTHLARAAIHALQGPQGREDVPSPTFTLVQTYDVAVAEIWHADLYRLTHPDEVMELGLEAAFEDAICLVEWPDRLGDATPTDALRLTLSGTGDTSRRLAAYGGAAWSARLAPLTEPA